MDDQTTVSTEPAITPVVSADATTGQATPDPVLGDAPVAEPPQAEPAQAPTEPISTPPATAQAEPVSEPTETLPETGTAQMGRSEPLPESPLEPVSQGAVAPKQSEARDGVNSTEIPEVETLTAPPEQAPAPTQSSIGSAQPEPAPAEPVVTASVPMPAQAQVTTIPISLGKLVLQKARAIIQLRKQKKLNKIIALFAKQTSITNDEVEKLLHVSDATATRYLSELEKENKIVQTGKTGHAVTYTKR